MTDAADNQGDMATTTKAKTKSKGLPALVLADWIGSPTVVPGALPGEFIPGEPVSLESLGLTEKEARLLIQDGLPFVLTELGQED